MAIFSELVSNQISKILCLALNIYLPPFIICIKKMLKNCKLNRNRDSKHTKTRLLRFLNNCGPSKWIENDRISISIQNSYQSISIK